MFRWLYLSLIFIILLYVAYDLFHVSQEFKDGTWETRNAIIEFVNTNMEASDLGFTKEIGRWQVQEARIVKQKAREKNSKIYDIKVELEGIYLPAGETNENSFLTFDHKVNLLLDSSKPQEPIVSLP